MTRGAFGILSRGKAMTHGTPQERFQTLLRQDRRFMPEAYNFVFEALDYTVRLKHKPKSTDSGMTSQHVTGQDLLEGIRQHAIASFGCLAPTVLDCWGVGQSEDFGDIVFNLIEYGLMGSQESDSKADFAKGYDGLPFHAVFSVKPVLEYSPEKDEWKASYESAVYG
ncbi:MAG: Minf_1886 family protein [Planctomycetota bacterium]